MSHLYTSAAGTIPGFPGAIFRAHDPIPAEECDIGASAPTVEDIANHAHSEGQAHTFLNGELFTDLDATAMEAYCSAAYAPQT